VFKSTNAGGSWAGANTGLTELEILALAMDPTTPERLFVGTLYGGVFKSTNSGASWTAANSGLTNLTVNALAIDPSSPATLYAATDGGGVFKSTDSGGNWAALNTGLTNLSIYALAFDPTGVTTLYAGLWGGSVWQLSGAEQGFYTVPPCRVFDTRDPLLGGPTALGGGSTTPVLIAGQCGFPSTATAAALNVAMTAASAPGFLTLFPVGSPQPLVSVINYAPGQTRANNAVAPLGPSGALNVFVGQATGDVHVIVDVTGYFR
jgi:hypothetical protein